MRSLIRVLAVLLIGLVVVGFYRGWFSLSSSTPDAQGDKVNVNVSVDKGKIKSDVKKAEGKVKEEIKELEGKVKAQQERK
jgi:major membrane immunogen (membrane-anchored lipoprotein)